MKKLLLLVFLVFSIVTFPESSKKKLNVAIIYSYKGRGDRSRNDFAYEGLMRAKKELDIEFKEVIQKISTIDIEYQLRAMAKSGKYDLIIGIPKEIKLGIEEAAKEFPQQKFLVAYERTAKPLPNVVTVLFREEEGGFMAGALAAMMNKGYSVGFIGSTSTENVKRYEAGFRQGVKYVKKDMSVIVKYVDSESESPFLDTEAAKRIAENLIKRNRAGVIFHNASASGLGVLNAAQENGAYVISSEQEEDKSALGTVLTSIMTDLGNPIYQAVKDLKNGSFKGQLYSYGFAEKGIRMTDFPYTRDKVGSMNIEKLSEIKEKIIKKEIKVVPTF